jgi:hypothetical protein
MNQALVDLISKRRITREEGLNRSTLPEELEQLLKSAGAGAPPAGSPAVGAAGATSSPFGRR